MKIGGTIEGQSFKSIQVINQVVNVAQTLRDFTISAVDPTKAFVIVHQVAGTGDPDEKGLWFLQDATTLRCQRGVAANNLRFHAVVLEYF